MQIGSIHSATIVYNIFFAYENELLMCFLYNVRVLNIQVQLVCMLLFSLTRFAKSFFQQQFFKMNHYLIGVLMKMIIVIVPAYINFVLGHTCGFDIFCPKDFRHSYNLVSYSGTMEFQKQMVSLIMENLDCRKNLAKVVLSTCIPTFLLLNLCIMAKELSSILPLFQTVTISPSEAVELRTVSAMEEHAEAPEDDHDQPQNTDNSDSYSVGVMTGVITILAISIGKICTLMLLYHKASALMSLMMQLILSILIPLLWLVTNSAIIRTRFGGPQQT